MPTTMPIPRPSHKKKEGAQTDLFRAQMLAWYDTHARVLPWRGSPSAGPCFTANPYHVWLSEVMLQQTTVQAVIPYFGKFVDKWPSVHDLAMAPSEEVMTAWAGLGYYARARNLHKCAQVVSRENKGKFPNTLEELKKLPGVGDYTAAAIAAIAFDLPATVIDGNVDRVISRYFAVTDPLPGSKPEIRALAAGLADGRTDRPGDFAQSMMDLGATVCIPKNPRCDLCPVRDGCAGRAQGIAAELPAKAPKKAQPQRWGLIYWITNPAGDAVLLERRPDTGMLGGMVGLPTTEWADRPVIKGRKKPDIMDYVTDRYPGLERVRDNPGAIRHTFTHFDLDLIGVVGKAKKGFVAEPGQFWHPLAELSEIGFPTVFKKFVNLCILK